MTYVFGMVAALAATISMSLMVVGDEVRGGRFLLAALVLCVLMRLASKIEDRH